MMIKHKFRTLTSLVLVVGLISGAAQAAASPITKEQWVQQNAHQITSLDSNDYSDLDFLKPLLQDKKIVSLGENFHRVAEYSEVKTRLIKYLHEKLGYDVIAFETGMGDAAAVYEDRDQLTPAQMMEGSLFPIWHSKETLELFKYIKEQSTTAHPLYLAGYDMQFNSAYISEFISQWISSIDSKRGKYLYKLDLQAMTDLYAVINEYDLSNPTSDPKYMAAVKKVQQKYAPQYLAYIKWVNNHKSQLTKQYPDNPKLVEFISKTLTDRIKFINMNLYDTRKSYEYRDQAMYDNLQWLMKTIYPGKKVMLWAHNDHLAKNTSLMLNVQPLANGQGTKWGPNFTSMGELLHKKMKDDMYVLGLYMNQGQASKITTGETFDIPPMPEESLENTLLKSGYANTFIDISKSQGTPGSDWLSRPVFAAEDGMTDDVIHPMSMCFVPREQFDGILLIDRVKAPTTKYEGGFMQQQ